MSSLGRLIDAAGLTALLAAFGTSGIRRDQLHACTSSLPAALSAAAALLCLGDPVAEAAVDSLLDTDELRMLDDAGFVSHSDGLVRLPTVRLIEHLGTLIFVGHPGRRFAYYGRDSVGLGRLALGARGTVLDLFAATGAQSMLAARLADRVHAVEIDADLIPLFQVNARLNDVADRVHASWVDAATIDDDTLYDTIIANAPLLPNFGLGALPVGTDGGFDGSRLLESAITRVNLADGGRLLATVTLLGSEAGPDIRWLETLAEQRRWATTVISTGHAALQSGTTFANALVEMLAADSGRDADTVAAELDDVWTRDHYRRIYFCLISAAAKPQRAGVSVVHTSHGSGWML